MLREYRLTIAVALKCERVLVFMIAVALYVMGCRMKIQAIATLRARIAAVGHPPGSYDL